MHAARAEKRAAASGWRSMGSSSDEGREIKREMVKVLCLAEML